MSIASRVLMYQLRDVSRSRWVIAYGLLFFGLTELLFRTAGGGDRVLLSLLNVVLLLVPLVSVLFGTLYLYSAREFIELLLAQPVERSALFGGLFGGLVVPLSIAFIAGVGAPFAIHGGGSASGTALATLLTVGTLLTLISVALAFLIALRFEDRARGFGVALLAWLGATIVYDGIVLIIITLLEGRPLETPTLALMFLNPVDLARVILLMSFDLSALMGYTGAVFLRFFGSGIGVAASLLGLAAWAALPLALGFRAFKARDL